jgi:hypothetical protein
LITTPSTFASTPSDLYIVSSDTDAEVKTMELKAVNDRGISKPVSSFVISPENVVSVQQNGKVTVFSTFPLAFSGVKIYDTRGIPTDIPISTNGEVSLATLPAGVYALDVIVNNSFAYESIINIGQQPQQQVNQYLYTVNQRTDVSVTTTVTCPVNSTLVNGTCVPSPSPIICPENGTSTNQTCPIFPLPNFTIPLPNGTFPNGTIPTPNGTLPNGTIPITNLTQPTPPETNATEPTPPGGGGGDDGDNQTTFSEPPLECPEGEQLAPDGLSCEPISSEELMPACGEGEELVDGQCQLVPTDEDLAVDEEDEPEPEDSDVQGGDGEGDGEGDGGVPLG